MYLRFLFTFNPPDSSLPCAHLSSALLTASGVADLTSTLLTAAGGPRPECLVYESARPILFTYTLCILKAAPVAWLVLTGMPPLLPSLIRLPTSAYALD